jgi:hypothetical protein
MKPVYELVQRYSDLRSIGFPVKDEYGLVTMMGGVGYGALGSGIRIGGGGCGGSREYTRSVNDTTYTLEVGIGYGGFMVEKALVAGDFNLFAGLMLGGGGIDVQLRSTVGTSFINVNPDPEDLPAGKADVGFFLVEAHGGFTYSILSWMHLGADITVPCFLSGNGFKIGSQSNMTDGFVTVNPGLRLRIMFGNIG